MKCLVSLSYAGLAISNCGINVAADAILYFHDAVIVRIASDVIAHGLTAGICHFMFTLPASDQTYWRRLSLAILCALAAVSIDIDRFVAAESLNLSEAMSLPRRPA